MSDKVKNIVVTIVFVFILVFFFILSLVSKDTELSYSERRKLAQFPEFSISSLLSGEFMSKFNTYVVDQFPFREEFRNIKANIYFNLFKQKANNDVYVIDDSIFKIEYPYSENSIIRASKKFNDIYDKYLQNSNVYYSIIPDKNYFVAKQNGYPSIDYDKLAKTMNENVKNMEYIDIYDCLKLADYYKTDTHWSQDKIQDVANRIAEKMNFSNRLENVEYEVKEIPEFYGVYYGQLALNIEPDTIRYLTNETIQNATVFNYENNKTTSVYDMDKLNGMDKYDMFLSGAVSLMKISNPNAQTDKELIVFRDSFGSSIVPLFIPAYSSITLIDIRYINNSLLGQYVDFENKDVLFLYSSLILNNSAILQ